MIPTWYLICAIVATILLVAILCYAIYIYERRNKYLEKVMKITDALTKERDDVLDALEKEVNNRRL